MLSKMEQLKAIESQIKEVTKKKDLMDKIQKGFQEAGALGAPLCIKVNPKYPNYMPLEEAYLPESSESFIGTYIQNMDDHLAKLNSELESVFN